MSEKNMNQEFKQEKIEKIRNYLLKERNQNELMSKNHTNVCRVLNYIDHLLIVISTIASISAFCLVGIL